MKNTINDCFVDIIGEKPSQNQIDDIIDSIPLDIMNLAIQWGPNDTEFREKVFAWMKENIEIVSS
ncbi:MAG: hypothetical protein K0R18_446 [Bacillales bacterium]|jgi:hypothetical protein|nr:hypothetical protein [Bacillales bacterium]